MSIMRSRLACCSRDRGISIDFDEQERVTTYDGLESCILNINQESFETDSHASRDPADCLDDKESVCSSSKDPDSITSLSLKWLPVKKEKSNLDDWELSGSPQHYYVNEKPIYAIQNGDIETMKEKFAKLLLGEDSTGGCKGVNTALALSNAITNLAATVFGELWKLEPLSEEKKSRWRREMDWLLSPTKYMVELVPAKQNGPNGCTLEIMTPIARADIHMNLPALQKLDSMLIEFLDAMVSTEFWYAEGGSRAEGRSKSERQSKRWWLPSPQVPRSGLSDNGRKRLMCQGMLVRQVFKAATSINESVLREMPIPTVIRNALPKSGKAGLSDELYKVLATDSGSVENMFNSLRLKSEHRALDCLNKLEAAIFAWKEKISGHESGKSPRRSSWSFMKDPLTELDTTQCMVDRAESLVQYIKLKYPNLPQTFIDATKVQFGKDIGHAILEAYSRVLGNLSYSIMSRIKDILQEDIQSNPNSPALSCYYSEKSYDFFESPVNSHRIRHSLIDRMNGADFRFSDSCSNTVTSDSEMSCSEAKTSSVMETPSRSRNRVWCSGKDGCISLSPSHSPS